MRALVNTISVSLTVRSSSLLAPSCCTDGRMHTGGTEIYCQMNSSGRPCDGFRPSNSQSYNRGELWITIIEELRTSSDIRLNKSSTFRGFRSSVADLPTNIANSFCCWIALVKVAFHFSISSALFFARNLSWTILSAPCFFTVPFVPPQYGQKTTFLAVVLTALQSCCRARFSSFGRRKRLRYLRRSSSDNITRAHVSRFPLDETTPMIDGRTYFAYLLKDGNNVAEETNMEYR